MNGEQTKAVARNKAFRTFLQNAGVDVLAALVLLIFPIISNANGWQDVDWKVMGFMVAKTVLASFLAYLMRVMRIGPVVPDPGNTGGGGGSNDPSDPNYRP